MYEGRGPGGGFLIINFRKLYYVHVALTGTCTRLSFHFWSTWESILGDGGGAILGEGVGEKNLRQTTEPKVVTTYSDKVLYNPSKRILSLR